MKDPAMTDSAAAPAPTTSSVRRGPSWQLGWMIPAGISLLAGLNAGLQLMGLPAPLSTTRLPTVHGMLLIFGFVATLVALERATALGRWYGYLAPAILGVGGLLLLADPVPILVGKWVLTLGAAAFMLLYIPLWRRQYDAALLTQLLGAGLALAGALLWIGNDDFSRVVPWLVGFLVLTIGAERVELARITMGPKAGSRLLVHAWAITIALGIGLVYDAAGSILLGLTLVSLVSWLVIHDVARRTIRATGVTRYMAACILSGYVWLAVAAIALLFGTPSTQPVYDAVVHGVFLGYTFSMIMAHATTILPAVLKIALPYTPMFWVPAGLLQVALIARIWIGDALGLTWAWHVGGYLGVSALLLLLLTAVTTAVVTAIRSDAPRGAARLTTPIPSQEHA